MTYAYRASVIIPTFNRIGQLKETLGCLAHQSASPDTFEVIVVDDASTDNTVTHLEEVIRTRQFSYALSVFSVGHADIFGASIARNRGIHEARGEYLLFLDDDCLPHRDWVLSQCDRLAHGDDVVVGNLSHTRAHLESHLPLAPATPAMERFAACAARRDLAELTSGNLALRRECFERAGMFDERFAQKDGYGYEDIEFGHRLLIAGYVIGFNPNALVVTDEKPTLVTDERIQKKIQAKQLWWHIIMHPQQDLPITPLLYDYAERKKAELVRLRTQHAQ